MGKLNGKVAIITGASGGQGSAEARLFAAEGAKVVLTDLAAEGGSIAESIGSNAIFVSHDISKEGAWQDVVDAALSAFGAIDILVNNAAAYRAEPLQNTDLALFERLLSINVVGTFLGMRAVIEPMMAAGGGSIINVASAESNLGLPGSFPYGTTKWAVRGMTKTAAADLAQHNIRVNSLHPGLTDTAMPRQGLPQDKLDFYVDQAIPLRRWGQPAEMARAALFLASDDSSYMTGSELHVDGGITMA